MSPPLQAVRSILPLLFYLCFGQPIVAQSAKVAMNPPALKVEEIVNNLVRRNAERAQKLIAFEATRIYRLDYRGFPGSRSAEMIVDVNYHSPATKEFTIRSSSGSKLLIERVLNKLLQSEQEALKPDNQRQVALNNENYTFSMTGQENTPTGSCYILAVEPRTKNKLLYRGRIWVDAKDFAVTRIEAEPAKSPSFWTKETNIEHVYEKVGDFWLPRSNRSTSNTRLGGHALLTIDYSNYNVTAVSARTDLDRTIARHQ
jgi:hypothetical protein